MTLDPPTPPSSPLQVHLLSEKTNDIDCLPALMHNGLKQEFFDTNKSYFMTFDRMSAIHQQ